MMASKLKRQLREFNKAMLNDVDTAAKDTQNLQVFLAYKTTSLKPNLDNVGIICSQS